MNKVILMGRLTRDPEVRYTASNQQMAVSRYTAPSNDEDGIGIFLREYLRKEPRAE